MIVKISNLVITLNDPVRDFFEKRNLFRRWTLTMAEFLEGQPCDSCFLNIAIWAGLQLDGLLRGFLYVLCLRSQGCNPLIFGESELMTKWFKRLHGASVTRLKLHKWRLSCTLKCACFSLEEPVLPVQSNRSVSCERCCFQLQVLMNVDFTGNADTRVFLKMLKHASFLHFAKRKKKNFGHANHRMLFTDFISWNVSLYLQNRCRCWTKFKIFKKE